MPLRVTLLKGRSHYLCRQKFERMRADRPLAPSPSMQRICALGRAYADRRPRGAAVCAAGGEWEQLDADADECVGEHCAHFRDCFYFKKRDEANYADLVVVNHALFFLDLAVGGGLLPPYDVAVLDEAHQCERWATDAVTAVLSGASIGRMLRKIHRAYELPPSLRRRYRRRLKRLESTLSLVPGDRYPLAANDEAPARAGTRCATALYRSGELAFANWHRGAQNQQEALPEAERRRDLTAARGRGARVGDRSHRSAAPTKRSPGPSAAMPMRAIRCTARRTRSTSSCVRRFSRARRASCSTSATLSTDGSFDFARRTLGIDDAQELIAPSPFDYARQARLFIASPHVNPKSPEFARRAAPLVEECLDRTPRTRLRAVHLVRALARGLRARCASGSPFRSGFKANCRARI